MSAVNVNRLHSLTGHRDSVYTLEQGGDPAVFFSAGGDGMVVQWDLRRPEEGERIAQLPHSVYALHYIKDSDLLVVGHNFEGIHLLDCKNKKEVGSLKLSSASVFDIRSSGNLCFVASGDGSVTVVDLASLTVKKQFSLSEKSARTMALNPGRGELAVGYSDNYIRCFGLEDFQLLTAWEAHNNSVFTLAFTPDHKFLLSGSRDARLKAWQGDGNHALYREVAAHLYAINHVVFSPDGKHFVTCSMDKSVKVWDADSLTLLKVIDKARHAGHGTSVNKLLWSPFNNRLISASDDRTISIWDVIF